MQLTFRHASWREPHCVGRNQKNFYWKTCGTNKTLIGNQGPPCTNCSSSRKALSTCPEAYAGLMRGSSWSVTALLCGIKADDRQSTPERTLSGPWAPLVSLSFHLSSAFHTTSHFSTSYQMRQDSILLAFGSYPWICKNVARAACALWSRGSWVGAALVSALCICCFLAHRLLYGTLLSVFSLLFYIAIPIPEMIQLFVHLPIVHELISCLPAVLFFLFFQTQKPWTSSKARVKNYATGKTKHLKTLSITQSKTNVYTIAYMWKHGNWERRACVSQIKLRIRKNRLLAK